MTKNFDELDAKVMKLGEEISDLRQSRIEMKAEIERLREQIKPLQEITQSLLGEEAVCRDRMNSLQEKVDEQRRLIHEINVRYSDRLTFLEKLSEIHKGELQVLWEKQSTLEPPNQSDCPANEWAQRLERITSCDGGRTFQCQTCGNDLPTVKKKDERAETIRRAVDIFCRYPAFFTQEHRRLFLKVFDIAEQSIKGGGE